MILLAIEEDESKNAIFMDNEECREVLRVYPEFYKRMGYDPPWIGYFAERDNVLVGCGGFKGKPKDGKVEIAYGTFKKFEGQGVGTEICRQLVSLSRKADPDIRITARTLIGDSASTTILKRNGFHFMGVVCDEEDGDVWEWEYEMKDKAT